MGLLGRHSRPPKSTSEASPKRNRTAPSISLQTGSNSSPKDSRGNDMTSSAVLPLSLCPSMNEKKLPERTGPVVPDGRARNGFPAVRRGATQERPDSHFYVSC